jgi:hypothetical protein
MRTRQHHTVPTHAVFDDAHDLHLGPAHVKHVHTPHHDLVSTTPTAVIIIIIIIIIS